MKRVAKLFLALCKRESDTKTFIFVLDTTPSSTFSRKIFYDDGLVDYTANESVVVSISKKNELQIRGIYFDSEHPCISLHNPNGKQLLFLTKDVFLAFGAESTETWYRVVKLEGENVKLLSAP